MPRVFDNIDLSLLPALQDTLKVSERGDFCVGYFNLRGWKKIDSLIEEWAGGEGNCCRLLIGMQTLPADELRNAMSLMKNEGEIDNQTAIRIKNKAAEEFRNQLVFGIPTNEDEEGLRRLAKQIKEKKIIVKLFLRHSLHAKLYLIFRHDPVNPITGYLGSSNLTLAGLVKQGELNVDVLDHDATKKLAKWFEDRWNDHWCLDISDDLAKIIEESWAREELIPPYYIYLKMAYHLAKEAVAGLSEFKIPKDFGNILLDFQQAAVKIAAHHINKRNGVLIGDVVGLGKTLMATTVARIFEDDYGLETLILCPKNLVSMWEDYVYEYRLRAKVLSISRAERELPDLRRYRLVVIDESHNLRNREGKRYRAIQEYLRENESKCILLSATPYNKTYLDLSSQLRLFVQEDLNIQIRPERLLRTLGEPEFLKRHQCPIRSISAFEKSEYAEDWRELMRLYMVRRTRSFIIDNYAKTDPEKGLKYITFNDGTPQYFPTRVPKTVKFAIDEKDTDDQYARLYTSEIVGIINGLLLPRYGLGNYIAPSPQNTPSQSEAAIIRDLSRAGKRLMGFCRTNLFKRLESSGYVFLQSIKRHILRNYVYLYALDKGLEIPIGTQDVSMLDSRVNDEDADAPDATVDIIEDENNQKEAPLNINDLRTEEDFLEYGGKIYQSYLSLKKRKFKWLRADLFVKELEENLSQDTEDLLDILRKYGDWEPEKDTKIDALQELITVLHPDEKVIVFTQFADTVNYLEEQFKSRGSQKLAGVTGDSEDPTELAWRFSPVSNKKRDRIKEEDELRVLIATDVLSEGQNLQDCFIVVNYDLPWAIIRLIQRAGRVDRIGQHSEEIFCYSFLPADGVNRVIRLRERIRNRLQENAEVVGTDEAFFEDDRDGQAVVDLYNEKAGILDGEADTEVDLSSYAYQIWKNAIEDNPKLQKIIPELPPVVYSTRHQIPSENVPEGILLYMRTPEGNDALSWVDKEGNVVTESQLEIIQAAECKPDTPAIPRLENHHQLVKKGVELILKEEKSVGGQLGRPSSARRRTYDRLIEYVKSVKGTIFDTKVLRKAIEEIYRYTLKQSAIDTLNRQLRSGVSNQVLAELVVALRNEDRLCIIHEEEELQEPQIICSMGLSAETGVR